jgi:hypothetical protein
MTETISKEIQQCVEACRECKNYCAALATSGGLDSRTIVMMKDCAEMCLTCSNLVLRESHFAAKIRKLCAEACNDCAAACEKASQGKIAQDCAAACRHCADACLNRVDSPVHA